MLNYKIAARQREEKYSILLQYLSVAIFLMASTESYNHIPEGLLQRKVRSTEEHSSIAVSCFHFRPTGIPTKVNHDLLLLLKL